MQISKVIRTKRKMKYGLFAERKNILLTGEAYTLFEKSSYIYNLCSDPHLQIYQMFEFFREIIGYHISITPYGDRMTWTFNISDIYNDPKSIGSRKLSYRKVLESRTYQRFTSYYSAGKASIRYANTIFNNREEFKINILGEELYDYSLYLNIPKKGSILLLP